MKAKATTTIGLDLGDRKHSVCVLDHKGRVIKKETPTNTPESRYNSCIEEIIP